MIIGDTALPSPGSVTIEIKDLIELMSGTIARKVADELREQHIEPLSKRVSLLERLLGHNTRHHPSDANTKQIIYWKGALDTLWKVGVALVGLCEAYHYLKH